MKITKSQLKQIIKEVLNEGDQKQFELQANAKIREVQEKYKVSIEDLNRELDKVIEVFDLHQSNLKKESMDNDKGDRKEFVKKYQRTLVAAQIPDFAIDLLVWAMFWATLNHFGVFVDGQLSDDPAKKLLFITSVFYVTTELSPRARRKRLGRKGTSQ